MIIPDGKIIKIKREPGIKLNKKKRFSIEIKWPCS
jgi:hypothetical protein